MKAAVLAETLTASALHWRLAVPPAEHPIFAGHFPGHPVLPGVVILGWMVAAAERFLGRELLPPTLLHNVKFPLVLLPGQTVELHVIPAPAGRLSVRVTSAEGIHATVIVQPGAVFSQCGAADGLGDGAAAGEADAAAGVAKGET